MNSNEDSLVSVVIKENSCVCKEISDDVKNKGKPEKCVINERLSLHPSHNISAYVKQIKYLNLSRCSLQTIDSSLSLLMNLLELNLSGNQLSTLPDTLVACKKLQSLDLSENCFEKVPNCVMKLNFIIELNLSHNPINDFDDPPNCLSFLKRLNASHTKLETLPKWLFSDSRVILELLNLSHNRCFFKAVNATILYQFEHSSSFFSKSLKKLDLSNCSASPKDLGLIKYFDNLQYLHIGNESGEIKSSSKSMNCLWDLPPSLFLNKNICGSLVSVDISNCIVSTLSEDISSLSSLKVLDVSRNELNWLPISFTQLVNLEVCNFSFNRISMLPSDFSRLTSLRKLFISHNQLEILPPNLDKLVNLEFVDLYGNYLEEFPVEAVKALTSQNLKGLDFAWNKCDLPHEDSKVAYAQLQTSYRSTFVATERRENTRCPVEQEVLDYESDERSSSSHNEILPDEDLECNICISEEELWDADDSFDDQFDPTVPNLGSWASSCHSLPLASTPPIGYYVRDDMGPLYYPSEKMLFCPADNHPPSIKATKRPQPQNCLLTSEQFEDS